MKIDDDHMYHGAALTQVAEDPHFTAINAVNLDGRLAENSFRINDGIGLHVKYSSTKPIGSYKEYQFAFTQDHLSHLEKLQTVTGKVFIALVCVKAREICCISFESLRELIQRRKVARGGAEAQYVLPVTLAPGGRFRVYINKPGVRGTILGDAMTVPRNAFPRRLFTG